MYVCVYVCVYVCAVCDLEHLLTNGHEDLTYELCGWLVSQVDDGD